MRSLRRLNSKSLGKLCGLLALTACGAPESAQDDGVVEPTESEPAAAAQSAGLTLALDEAFVWAGASGGTPDPRWSYNSENGSNNVVRVGTGQYRVELGKLYSDGGNAIVSAYGSGSHRCKVQSWGLASAAEGGVNVYVRCHAPGGALVDGSFVLSYVGGNAPAPYAHLWTQYGDRDHTAPAFHSKNSAGQTNHIDWTAAGQYTITLNGLNSSAGHVQVSAYGTDAHHCNVSSWSQSADDTVVRVRCYDSAGTLANSRFALRYVTTGMGFSGRSDLAYAWANNATSSSYTPHSSYRFNSLPGEPAITATRSGVGKYALTLPGMPLIGTTALVTAYGGSSNYCHTKGWAGSETSAAGDGASSTLEVSCFNAQGNPVDSQFTAAYVHVPPTQGAVCGWGAADCNRCVEGVESLFASANTTSASHQHGRLGTSTFEYLSYFTKHNEGIGRLNHPDGRYVVLARAMSGEIGGQLLMFRLSGYPSTQGAFGSSASHSTANTVVWSFVDPERSRNHTDGLSVMGNYFIHGIACEDDACGLASNTPHVYLWDATNPASPRRTLDFDLVNWLGDVSNATSSAAATTIVKLASGRYLIIVKSRQINNGRAVRFLEGRSLSDVSTWSQSTVLLESAIEAWDDDDFNYQHISAVTDCSSGRIYVIATKGADTDCDDNESDVARLYELGMSGSEYTLTVRGHRYFNCIDNAVAFGSAAGVYVSRDGRMNFYSSESEYHTVDTGVKVKFREFYSGSL